MRKQLAQLSNPPSLAPKAPAAAGDAKEARGEDPQAAIRAKLEWWRKCADDAPDEESKAHAKSHVDQLFAQLQLAKPLEIQALSVQQKFKKAKQAAEAARERAAKK